MHIIFIHSEYTYFAEKKMKTLLHYRRKDGTGKRSLVDLTLSADFTAPGEQVEIGEDKSYSSEEDNREVESGQTENCFSPFAVDAQFTLIPEAVSPFSVSGESLPSAEIGITLTEHDASLFPDAISGSSRTGGGEFSDQFGKNATREVSRLLDDYFSAAEDAGLYTSPFLCTLQARFADGSLIPVTPPVMMTPANCPPYVAINSILCDEKRLVTGVRIFNRACRLKVKIDNDSLHRLNDIHNPAVTSLEVWATLPQKLYDSSAEVAGFVSVKTSGATFTGSEGGSIPFPSERQRCWNFPMKRGVFPDIYRWRPIGVIDLSTGEMHQLNDSGLASSEERATYETPDFAAIDSLRLQEGVRICHNGLTIVCATTPRGTSPCETLTISSISSPFIIYKPALWRESDCVEVGREKRIFPMIYNPAAGGYFAFSGFNMEEPGKVCGQENNENEITEDTSERETNTEEDMIFMSAPGNPHLFPSRSKVKSPGGKIIGVAPVEKSISASRIGDYPFYCITTEGAWLMKRNDDGIMTVVQRISAFGALSESHVAVEEGCVEFMSPEGLVRLDGLKAELIGPPPVSESRRLYLSWRYRLKPGERLLLTCPFSPEEEEPVSLCGIKTDGRISRIYVEAGDGHHWLPIGMFSGCGGAMRMAAAQTFRLAAVMEADDAEKHR